MRNSLPWVIYGANGVTGRLVLAAALEQGQRPVVAGRDACGVRALAERHGLEPAVVSLDDRPALEALLRRSSRVLHTAGPFTRTAAPMLDACLATATPYIDLGGELDAVAATLSRDAEARRASIPLVAGAGFGVTAGDCIAAHVAHRRPRAKSLLIGVDARNGHRSVGAALSRLEVLGAGGAWIEGGALTRGAIAHRRFGAGLGAHSQVFVAAPLAEALAAHRTTGIADVVAGIPVPRVVAPLMPWLAPLLQLLARRPALRRLVTHRGGGAEATESARRQTSLRSAVWAQASDDEGSVTSVLEMGEGYAFAAAAMVLAARRVGEGAFAGAFTPAAALGADFVLQIEGVSRRDLVQAARP
jgi:saccharopine dehydrogenase (NAD+, L-lysine-forming)